MDDVSAKDSLRILSLEDDPNDRQLLAAMLSRDGLQCDLVYAGNAQEFELALGQGKYDLIMSDYTLPDYDGVSALAAARRLQPDTPFVLVSGTIGEERAVRMLKSGATDCVLKDNLARLGTVLRRALAEAGERRKRLAAEEALREQTVQLRALAGRLQASREEERMRISREIHDELGEALTSQKLGLMWIKQRLNALNQPDALEPVFGKIDFLGTLTDGTAGRVRRLCTELRPPILDDLGLSAAIEWQTREFQNRTNIECKIHPDSVAVDLEPEPATALFRIFQEILTNVARHAKATRVDVEMTSTGGNLMLEVKDNGKGIPSDKISGGVSLGILGMRERAALLGGRLAIRGTPGKGTTVIVSLPIKNNNHPHL
jgi:two-component system sensor histidine kinase UhpB